MKAPKLILLAPSLSLIAILLFMGVQPATHSSSPTQRVIAREGFGLPEEDLGERMGLQEAKQRAAFSFNVPDRLPSGTTLERVYLHKSGEIVYLFYNNSQIPLYQGSFPFTYSIWVSIVKSDNDPVPQLANSNLPPIIEEVKDKDGERIVGIIPKEPEGKTVKVCGVDALGRNSPQTGAGVLLWWKDGVQYRIGAVMPMSELATIGNSMC